VTSGTTGYNIPELAGLTLVLDFDTIARVYLNEITLWNDTRIKNLNSPEVAAALPSRPIIVITQSSATGLTNLFTTVLDAMVPDFAARVRAPHAAQSAASPALSLTGRTFLERCDHMLQVGAGSLVSFPVQSAANNRSIVVPLDVIGSLRTIPYSFAFWPVSDIRQVLQQRTARVLGCAS
jgi:hypothetical protein